MVNPSKKDIEVYKNSCKTLVETEGDCNHIDCDNCPFSRENNGYDKSCIKLGAAKTKYTYEEDPVLVDNAQKFLDGIIIFQNGELVEVVDE